MCINLQKTMNLNLKNLGLFALITVMFSACGNAGSESNTEAANHENADSDDSEWISLFDGETTQGWHTYLRDTVGSAWSAVDGELRFDPSAPSEGRGDIVTDESFGDFDLQLEWQISSGGNSGIFFGVHEDPQYSNTYRTGIEMQVLDNIDGADNQVDTHLAGNLYDLMGSRELSQPKPVGEWNEVRILRQNNRITFWLNGIETADVEIGTGQWQEILESSKFKDWEGFAQYSSGKIGLQDHGDVVAYRNIRIKKL